jgi:HK97 family phage prohead protease
MEIEHKSFGVEMKAGAEGGFMWDGYVAGFDNIDSYGDIIEKGAFLGDIGTTIPAFFEHKIQVGKMFLIGEDAYGLKVRGELAPDSVQDPRVGNLSERIRWMMADSENVGVLTVKMSIGFYPVEFRYERRGDIDVRIISKIKLVEGSLVMNPANENAVLTDWKSDEVLSIDNVESMSERDIEAALKTGRKMSGNLAKKVVSAIKAKKNNQWQEIVEALKSPIQ